jgi:hypothetical protein
MVAVVVERVAEDVDDVEEGEGEERRKEPCGTCPPALCSSPPPRMTIELFFTVSLQ